MVEDIQQRAAWKRKFCAVHSEMPLDVRPTSLVLLGLQNAESLHC